MEFLQDYFSIRKSQKCFSIPAEDWKYYYMWKRFSSNLKFRCKFFAIDRQIETYERNILAHKVKIKILLNLIWIPERVSP